MTTLSGKWRALAWHALSLLIGAAGGSIFNVTSLPLPWLLGSMAACLVASLLRVPVTSSQRARAPMAAVVGVLIGSSFTPSILQSLDTWVVPLIGMVGVTIVAGGLSIAYFRCVVRTDYKTAYYAGMPGGVVEMVLQGEQAGADSRTIALVHAARVLLVVSTAPIAVTVLSGPFERITGVGGISFADVTPTDWLWFMTVGSFGALIGHLFHFPAKYLLGPMLLSTAVHGLGWTDFAPPSELVIVAQIVIGTNLGCRFSGSNVTSLLKHLAVSGVATFIMTATAFLAALAVSQVSVHSAAALFLAYAPGGFAEMGLIAVALQVQPAFVVAHHILRIFLVSSGAAVFSPAKVRGRNPPPPR